MEMFNNYFDFEKNGTKGAIRFLAKYLEQNKVRYTNNELYKAYLLNILNNDERSLSQVCSIIMNNSQSLDINEKDINLILKLINKNLKSNNDLEVIWLIYLLIKVKKLNRSNKIIDSVIESENEMAITLLLSSGSLCEKRKKKVSIKAKSWLLLYELFQRNEITTEDFVERLKLNNNKEMYEYFKEKKISFCTI